MDLDAVWTMRATREAYELAKQNPDATSTQRNQARIRYFQALRKATALSKQRFHGIPLDAEYHPGETRRGTGKDGKAWKRTMHNEYGHIRRTSGADGEALDYYMGPNEDSQKVFVVNQMDQDSGRFDEHKLMLGFDDQASAVAAYKRHYPPGWRVGPVVEKDTDWLKGWMHTSRTEYIAKMQWNESLHPRDNRGRFTSGAGGAPSAHAERLTSSGHIGKIEGNFPDFFLARVGEALEKVRVVYPQLGLKEMRLIDKPGMTGMHTTAGSVMEVYGSTVTDPDYEMANQELASMSEKQYVQSTIRQVDEIAQAMEATENPKDKDRLRVNKENYQKVANLIASGQARKPSMGFVGSDIQSTVIHETGHIATGKLEGDFLDIEMEYGIGRGGVFNNPEVLKSAMKLSHYAVSSFDEYIAEAWCAFHTGREDLLDRYSMPMVRMMDQKLKHAAARSATHQKRV